jgi:predicted peptidase
MRYLMAILGLVAVARPGAAEDYEALTHEGPKGARMPYRLLKPAGDDKADKYPLVLVLHGWGERGTDNKAQLKTFGPPFLKPAIRKKFPCYVLIPQANGSWVRNPVFDKPIPLTDKPAASLSMALEILDGVMKNERVDADRLYLMGYSNGACGVWELLERFPNRWAAAAPMAGAGDPERVVAAKEVPIWAFHGEKDKAIPLARMEELMTALRTAGSPGMYTVVPGGAHWDAQRGLGDRNLLPWMFAQRRGTPAAPFDKVAGPKDKRPTSLQK